MRLKKVENGQRLPQKIMLRLLRMWSRSPVPDVARATLYRPELFGNRYNAWIHAILRGRSSWSVGERELFAAFTSRLNQCPF